MHLRRASWADRDGAYAVALATGDSGADASGQLRHPDLLGEVFVGPYLAYAPEHAFVLVDDHDLPVGYVLGVVDTRAFEATLEADWWPGAVERSTGLADPTPVDRWLIDRIRTPVVAPDDVVARFPAHGHIDLTRPAQGQGWGRRMMTTLMDSLAEAGASGMHLEVGLDNARALGFYDRLGFTRQQEVDDAVYLGRPLP